MEELIVNKTMTKPRNRENRTKPNEKGYSKITLYISPSENAILHQLMQKGGYAREEIFLHGMYDLMH